MTDDPGPSVRTAKSQQRVPSSCVVAYGRQRTGGLLVQGDPRVVGRVWRAEGASLYCRPGAEALRDDLAIGRHAELNGQSGWTGDSTATGLSRSIPTKPVTSRATSPNALI